MGRGVKGISSCIGTSAKAVCIIYFVHNPNVIILSWIPNTVFFKGVYTASRLIIGNTIGFTSIHTIVYISGNSTHIYTVDAIGTIAVRILNCQRKFNFQIDSITKTRSSADFPPIIIQILYSSFYIIIRNISPCTH